MDGNFIGQWRGANDAAKELNINACNINSCANGSELSYKKYLWSYEKIAPIYSPRINQYK